MQKHLKDISIRVIPHNKHRYETCGDYYESKGTIHIRVSKMHDNHEFLVAIHELIEWYLIDKKGISIADIDQFDILYEKNRPKGDTSEPGDDPEAPYYKEHQFATRVERLVADELGVNWDAYDKNVNSL